MKTCSKCKESKLESEFANKRNKLQPYCRPCSNAASRAHYANNREHHKALINARNKRYLNETREWVRTLKEGTPCTDCGISYPWFVMDFDHVHGIKMGDISKMIGQKRAKQALIDEIAKCEIVCSNCHRVRTFTRSGHVETVDE